jgi:hypothetical protein
MPKRRRAPRKTMLVRTTILNLAVLNIRGITNTMSLPRKQMLVYILAITENTLKIASLIPVQEIRT